MATMAEYEDLLTQAVQNPDTLPTVLLQLRDYAKADTTALESLQQKLAENESKIRDLQDTNTSLFLRVSTEKPQEDTETEAATVEDTFAAFIKEEFNLE